MKIAKVETFILKVPLGEHTFYSSQAAFPVRKSFLVRITTSDGIVGWGEGGQYGPAEPVQACVESVLAPMLIELGETSPRVFWEKAYAQTRDFGQKGTYIEAISALDIALHDALGKELGVPISTLMGGRFRDKVRAYGTGGYYSSPTFDPDTTVSALADEVQAYADSGFSALKIKIGLLPIRQDALRVRKVREVLGADFQLLVDANHAYNSATAIAIGRHLEDNGYELFEEPVPPEDRIGYARVRDALSVPIAGGEAEYTRYGFRDFITSGAVDIIQPDVCVTGGVSEVQNIIALATTYNLRTIPHIWGSGIAFNVGLQVCSALPLVPYTYQAVPLENEPIVEYDRTHNPLRDDLLTTAPVFKDGYVEVPTGPGLGVEVDLDVLNKYAV